MVPHFLRVEIRNGVWHAVYDRDTRRYPSEYYDDVPFVRVELKRVPLGQQDDDAPFSCYGPIVVFKRKRFSQAERRQIWLQSDRKCHLCDKCWKLGHHGRKGWHVDHVIPNVGGGGDTEIMGNFRVSCAKCNLKKGRGYTEAEVREALRGLFT